MRKNRGRLAAFLAVAMVAVLDPGLVPGTGRTVLQVYAAGGKTVAGLGTSAMANPVSGGGGWSYVYYGKYDGTEPTKYRVLDKAATEFGGNTLLLDCDSTLYRAAFDSTTPRYSNVWADSTIRQGLNGEAFLEKPGNFTSVEAAAIIGSEKANKAAGDGDGRSQAERTGTDHDYAFYDYAPLTGEKIFLLDAVEVTRPSYGYANNANSDGTDSFDRARVKSGADAEWWFRSPNPYSIYIAGDIGSNGSLNTLNVFQFESGVSPAFNVDLSSVLFSSLVSGTVGEAGAEYKLTLKDEDLAIAVPEGQDVLQDGAILRVPYTVTDDSDTSDPTRISILVTDKAYTESDAAVLRYGSLTADEEAEEGDAGYFSLGSGLSGTWGKDYHVYLLAEDVNGEKETDYASVPVELFTTVSGTIDWRPTDPYVIEEASRRESGTDVRVEVRIRNHDGSDAVLIAAAYNDEGEMLGYGIQPVTLSVGASDTMSLTVEQAAKAKEIRLFVVDRTDYQPMSQVRVLE